MKHFETLVPKYMSGFACSGDACPDSCCGTWTVPVDVESYHRLQALMGPERADEFQATYVRSEDPGSSDSRFATIPMCSTGCSQLEAGLCKVHVEFGPDALADVCATYPRQVRRNGRRIELSGKASCPEVARLLMQSADAFELVPFELSVLPRQKAELVSVGDDVRDAMIALLGVEGAPLSTRLYYAGRFADHVDAGIELEYAWQRTADNDVLTALHHSFRAVQPDLSRVMHIVTSILIARAKDGLAYESFARLFEGALHTSGTYDLVEMTRVYTERRDVVTQRFGPRIELALGNLARNWWFAKPYTRSPDLSWHHRALLVRLVLIRWLFFCHPELTAVHDEAELNQLLVDVVYPFSRTFDHGESFLKRAVDFVPAGSDTLVLLAKF